MSDFGWFELKTIVFLCLIGISVYILNSGLPLWALLLIPSYEQSS